MDAPHLLFCLALVTAGFGLMQFESPRLRKFGIVVLCVASSLGMFFWTGVWWAAVLTMVLWIAFPISELVVVVRRLRVPRHRALEDAQPPLGDFDQLHGLSQDLLLLGFRQIDQCRLRPGMNDQFYRLFLHEDRKVQANITHVSHHGLGFHFLAFSSEDQAGRIWVTWNYPLTYGLKMPPGIALYRALHCETIEELYQAHLEFLRINRADATLAVLDDAPEAARSRVERSLQRQLDYNIELGILAPAFQPHSEYPPQFRYSWRGTFFVAAQVLRDLVRL